MKKIKYIRLPLPFVFGLKDGDIPSSLEYFHILNRKGDVDLICSHKKEYAEKLLFPQLLFQNVKTFSISNLSYSIGVEEFLKVTKNNFPNLEYLRCDLSVNLLVEFETLKHLLINGVNKVNIFEYLKSNIESLQIEGADKSFDIVEMKRKPSIEMIRFNSIYNDINCEHFLDMPNLREIFILNTSKVRNIEALLQMKSLKSLEIVNCKGSLNKSQKLMFKNKAEQFDRLEMDFAG